MVSQKGGLNILINYLKNQILPLISCIFFNKTEKILHPAKIFSQNTNNIDKIIPLHYKGKSA